MQAYKYVSRKLHGNSKLDTGENYLAAATARPADRRKIKKICMWKYLSAFVYICMRR